MVLEQHFFGVLALLLLVFCSCSGFDLVIVQTPQLILWIWARPNWRGFPPKLVVPKKEKLKNPGEIKI